MNKVRIPESDIELAINLGDFSHCETEEEYWEAVEEFALGLPCQFGE